MTRAARGITSAALGLALAGLLLSEASAQLPLCRTEVEVEPGRAVVGQQILYRLRILRRRDVTELDWEGNLGFPGFRAEWLPGISRDRPVDREAESYRVYEERRALFPVRSGVLEIPAVGLHCASRDREERAPIAAVSVEVDPIPAASRPSGFSGLVGPVEASVTVTPRKVALGEAARISVLVQGPANVWEVGSPLSGAFSLPDAELFARPREMARDVGRRLILRRYFSYDLVPRREGTIRIPEIRIPYFDPGSGRFEEVVLGASELSVTPAAPRAAGEDDSQSLPPAPPADERGAAGDRGVGWLALAVALMAALAAGSFGLLRWWCSPARSRWREIESGLEQAQAGLESGDHTEASRLLAKTLRAALAARVSGAQTLSAEEILERAEDAPTRKLAERLTRLDRERFQPDAPPPEIASLRSALEEAHRSWR